MPDLGLANTHASLLAWSMGFMLMQAGTFDSLLHSGRTKWMTVVM